MESLSKEKIRELWLSPEFPGHGLGLLAFKHELESRFNVKLSDKLIKSVLVEIPDYLSNISRRKKINRRNYNSVHGFGALMQADVAEFPPYHEFRYVFCAIDVYTQFLWTSVLKNKNSEAIKNAFEAIFKQYPTPDKLEVDQGGEFIRLEKVGYFKSRRIYLHFKREPNKACFVENAIFQLKRKVYLELRHSGSKNWPKLIAQMTLNFNARKHSSLGGLRPIDLDSKEKAVQLDFTTPKKEESFSENQIHRLEYEANPPIKVGDYVYAYVPKVRPRGFDVQRGALYRVRRIDSSREQPLFYLDDLEGRPQMHAYYKEELRVLPGGPKPNSTFAVERILRRREKGGVVEYFCSFKHYPRQFNRWVKREDLVK